MSELSQDAVAAVLTTRRLGRTTLFHPEIGSTNDAARELARAGAPDGTLVLTDFQTAGRGRLDRSWWAPAATCLLMSLVLRPPLPLALAGQLTMCLGLGAVAGVEDVTGLRADLKWPNDLLLNGRKLGGMLSELQADGDRLSYAVLGLGLNVNIAFETGSFGEPIPDMPAEVGQTATSLQTALGVPVDRLGLLAAILSHTESFYERVLRGETVHAEWAGRLDTLGRRVRISEIADSREGTAVGVTPEGGLILRDDAGVEHVIWSGDVVAVRPV